MTVLRNIRMLTRYTGWANERLFDALSKLPKDDAGTARHTGPGGMVHTLNHSYVVDLIWQAHLEGRAHGFTARNTDTTPPLEALRAAQRNMDDWYRNYADALSEQAHDEVVQFKFIDGGAGAMSRGDILLHVVNHKTYHRGYVADMLRQISTRPPTMDLPVFLRDVPLRLP
jgi:uncharacterized damage-inducible protein DinB